MPPQLYLSRHEDDPCRTFHEEEKLVSDSMGDAATQVLKTYTKNIQAGVVMRAGDITCLEHKDISCGRPK